jgi:hypothetical protein
MTDTNVIKLTIKYEKSNHNINLSPPCGFCFQLSPSVWRITRWLTRRCQTEIKIVSIFGISAWQKTYGLPMNAIWFQSNVSRENPSPLLYLNHSLQLPSSSSNQTYAYPNIWLTFYLITLDYMYVSWYKVKWGSQHCLGLSSTPGKSLIINPIQVSSEKKAHPTKYTMQRQNSVTSQSRKQANTVPKAFEQVSGDKI